jgi:hypothetical protein
MGVMDRLARLDDRALPDGFHRELPHRLKLITVELVVAVVLLLAGVVVLAAGHLWGTLLVGVSIGFLLFALWSLQGRRRTNTSAR